MRVPKETMIMAHYGPRFASFDHGTVPGGYEHAQFPRGGRTTIPGLRTRASKSDSLWPF